MKHALRIAVLFGLCALSVYGQTTSPIDSHEKSNTEKFIDQASHNVGKSVLLPDEESIKHEVHQVEDERKRIFTDPSLDVHPGVSNNFPKFATPQLTAKGPLDIAKLYETRAESRLTEAVYVFVSFSMPPESLKRSIIDADRIGATVVLRGFKGDSYKDTGKEVHALGVFNGNIQINPNAFTQYQIETVPAVVIAKPTSTFSVDSAGCALPENFVKVTGDVSLGFALEYIAKTSTAFRDIAERYSRPLKGRT